MQHRHMDPPPGKITIGIAQSIFERGTDDDVMELLDVLVAEPDSPAADTIVVAAADSGLYAYPALTVAIRNLAREMQAANRRSPC